MDGGPISVPTLWAAAFGTSHTRFKAGDYSHADALTTQHMAQNTAQNFGVPWRYLPVPAHTQKKVEK